LSRLTDIKTFYKTLAKLEKKIGGKKTIDQCVRKEDLPVRGLYFVFEEGEKRSNSGKSPRVVRVGVHALMPSSMSRMLNRMKLDRGNDRDLGGKHRRSMLRKHIGRAFMKRDKITCTTWEKRVKPGPREQKIEEKISAQIRNKMSFIYLNVDEAPNAWKKRRDLSRNIIALLSNYGEEKVIDAPSKKWLGNYFPPSITELVKASGLWNIADTDRQYDPDFLKDFDRYVTKMKPRV
jgi:hypothetical protein